MILEPEYVCFCLGKRHPNIFMGRRLPSNCRYCNAPFDINSIIPKEEAEAKGLLKMPEEAKPQGEEPPVAQPPVSPVPPPIKSGFGAARPAQPPMQSGFGAAQPSQPPMQSGFGAARPSQPPMQSGFGAAQPPQPPIQSGFGAARPARPPMQSGFGSGYTIPAPSAHSPAARECQLDYFGEIIAIPRDGGWIGRSAIGTQWLEGNLLVSREHVKVSPNADGSLQIGPDKSLNGTSVTIGGKKRALERTETVILSPGDTLWLYNVPLRLKRNES